MASRGSAACVPLAGCALLLLLARAGRKLALFAQRGKSTDAFCSISLCLVASKLAPNLHASRAFLTGFIHQHRLKGTFSMQANRRAMFTCHFPLSALFHFSLRDLNTSQLSTVLRQERGLCLCKRACACARTRKQMCPVQDKWGHSECHKMDNLWPVSAISQTKEVRWVSIKTSLFCLL